MSKALYDTAGLRFWDANALLLRNQIKDALVAEMSNTLIGMNQSWIFTQVETPLIMPRDRMNDNYTNDDVFALDATIADKSVALRAETTDGTYLMAQSILRETNLKPPLCVWQMGPSFRRELSDGATAAKLRFNQFTQLEFQCIYSESTKADYANECRNNLKTLVEKISGLQTRLVESDRLPSYSEETIDIEVLFNDRWTEVASTSKRTDFVAPAGFNYGMKVFEVAFGMDRMVAVSSSVI